MASFVRSARHGSAVEKISSGIEGLNQVLGEYASRGLMMMIVEDENSSAHSVMLRIFLSEGVAANEEILAVSKEEDEMWIYNTGMCADNVSVDKMVIAWRYSGVPSRECRSQFNLSSKRRIDGKDNVLCKKDATLEEILRIAESKEKLRIVIFSLMSPLWMCDGYKSKDTIEFMHRLKKCVRINKHVCIVSVPVFLCPEMNLLPFFDVVAEEDSNIFSGFCPNYNVILTFTKMKGYGCLYTNTLESLKYGVKIRKSGICVESIDIPPEDGEVQDMQCSKREF
ncbi:hypothetical protein CWI42_041260 [Ordospora colligata]|uniref:Elongator complex protein 4 n=1 Tax=Ordospora colligata OC4 TaxID=1354746 RepID=A0A0B2ULR2_9MICR|nr:uncharacterized protein M896_041270 [Ordospora colligata OC4]KHN69930.1 hypothetical protein M896_041270 [Ordospora colligata OC4]TBU16100.1 hypothetical protein CWI41_041260 [Ordospora colligata]TBU16313.1 hypothetical protein CWI40_041260 [Ordospora colligata]TBU19017.1 hypothetical protein CWI42_041260 [Ordospora colligata]